MVEYREIFLEEIKSFLSYFVKFEEDGKILPKKYPSGCAIEGLNQRLIIMLTHDKSIFSANDNQQKIWTLDDHNIFYLKGKGKGIMVSDFLLP